MENLKTDKLNDLNIEDIALTQRPTYDAEERAKLIEELRKIKTGENDIEKSVSKQIYDSADSNSHITCRYDVFYIRIGIHVLCQECHRHCSHAGTKGTKLCF